MTDRDSTGWGLPSRDDPAATAAGTVDPRSVLEHVNSLPLHEWEAPEDRVLGARIGPAREDVAERFGDSEAVTAGDLDGICLAAIQGLGTVLAEQRAVIEAQQATIDDQRDDIETLRERLEALQATVATERTGGPSDD